MTRKECYKKAAEILDRRRQAALEAARQRREEAAARIPQLRELEARMANASIQLTRLVLSGQETLKQAMPEIMEENLAAQRQIRSLLAEHHLPEDYLEERFTCPECRDTGLVQGKRCRCVEALVRKLAADDLNRSAFLSLCRLEDFDLSYYQGGERDRMERVYRFCCDYAAGFSLRSPNILMMGNTGLGKTHLSLGIAHTVAGRGFSVLYGTAPDLFERVQEERFGRGAPGEDSMEALLSADLLVLDDLGAEYENHFHAATLYRIVNARLNAGRPTIISTNLTPRELESRYGARISSRLMTLYQCLKFCGLDVRQQKLYRNGREKRDG